MIAVFDLIFDSDSIRREVDDSLLSVPLFVVKRRQGRRRGRSWTIFYRDKPNPFLNPFLGQRDSKWMQEYRQLEKVKRPGTHGLVDKLVTLTILTRP
jgi:hypothetical protein